MRPARHPGADRDRHSHDAGCRLRTGAGVNNAESITVTLRGVGCDDADCPVAPLTVNPAGLDMGTAAMGTQSAAVPLTITNNSAYTASFTGSSVTDPQFLVTRSCGSTLPPGTSCSGSVRFRPFRAGAAQATATTSFDLMDADATVVMTGAYTVAAQGFGIPGFMYSPRAVDLPPTSVGATSAPVTVTVRSLGGTLAGFSGVNAPAPFTSTTDCDAGVPPFGLCHDVVRFTPLASSRYTVTRGVGTTLGLYEVTISGQGRAAKLWATPTVLNFGTITAGTTSAPQHVAIVNVGHAPLAFDALPQPESDQYTLTSDCPEMLAPAARCTLTYRFQPRAAGSDDTEAAIATNGGDRKLRLWGYAAAGPVDEGDRIFLPHVPTR
ncbi:MAG: choice-of-anchor D domain-containing protein [Caldilineaceae bacterium]